MLYKDLVSVEMTSHIFECLQRCQKIVVYKVNIDPGIVYGKTVSIFYPVDIHQTFSYPINDISLFLTNISGKLHKMYRAVIFEHLQRCQKIVI